MWEVVHKDYTWSIFDNGKYLVGCWNFVEEAKLLCEIHNRSIYDKVRKSE